MAQTRLKAARELEAKRHRSTAAPGAIRLIKSNVRRSHRAPVKTRRASIAELNWLKDMFRGG
jgi:hypothetical protein